MKIKLSKEQWLSMGKTAKIDDEFRRHFPVTVEMMSEQIASNDEYRNKLLDALMNPKNIYDMVFRELVSKYKIQTQMDEMRANLLASESTVQQILLVFEAWTIYDPSLRSLPKVAKDNVVEVCGKKDYDEIISKHKGKKEIDEFIEGVSKPVTQYEKKKYIDEVLDRFNRGEINDQQMKNMMAEAKSKVDKKES